MKNSQFEISKSNILKYYRTPTIITTTEHEPSISVIKNVPYLMVPQNNSYSIYTLQDLKLTFISSTFKTIDYILQSGVFVYILSENKIFKTYRGEITSTYILQESENNNLVRKDTTKSSSVRKNQLVKFGEFFCVLFNNKIHVFENLNNNNSDLINFENQTDNFITKEDCFIKILYTLEYEKEILSVFHPENYLNKIFIMFEDGTAILYNLNSKKIIFNFDFKSPVICYDQTSIFDIFGFVYKTGIIKLFNLKKNHEIYSINFYENLEIKKIDFFEKFLLVIFKTEKNFKMSIFDLEIKREIYLKNDVFSGLIINEENTLIITQNSIEILNLSDMTILKYRKILNKNVTEMKLYSEHDILLKSDNYLYKMNVYRDEISRFLKVKNTPIQSIDFCSSGNILINGNNSISYINKDLKFKNFVTMKCIFSKVFNDFCMLCKKSGSDLKYTILIMNLKSKRVILKYKIDDFIGGDFDNETFTILNNNEIITYDFNCKIISKTQFISNKNINEKIWENNNDLNERISNENVYKVSVESNFLNISKIGNFYYLKGLDNIYIISKNDVRIFKGSSYSLSSDYKIIATVFDKNIYLYDAISGNVIESLKTNKKVNDIVILNDFNTFKYLAVLDSDSNIHLLSNLSHFNSMKNFQEFKLTPTVNNNSIVKKESSFYKDLLIFKESDAFIDSDLLVKSLKKEQVLQLTKLILKNIKIDFYGAQKVLNKLLLYKSQFIEREDLLEIQKEIEKNMEDYENKVLKTLSYLKLDKNNMI